jgi:hypothetical protein
MKLFGQSNRFEIKQLTVNTGSGDTIVFLHLSLNYKTNEELLACSSGLVFANNPVTPTGSFKQISMNVRHVGDLHMLVRKPEDNMLLDAIRYLANYKLEILIDFHCSEGDAELKELVDSESHIRLNTYSKNIVFMS